MTRVQGPAHPQWRGDEATDDSKHQRAQLLFDPVPCQHVHPETGEPCGRLPTDRAHLDGNPGNNDPSNVQLLCRRHHMLQDGRMATFLSFSNGRFGPMPPKPCTNCRRPSKPLRKGLCKTCSEYQRTYGCARPYVHDGRTERWERAKEWMADKVAQAQPAGRIRRGGGGV